MATETRPEPGAAGSCPAPPVATASRRRRAAARLGAAHPAAWALAAMVALYVGVFGSLTWSQQSNFGTFGFDMGIYDQGVWLLSRFRNPFVTVRGLQYFGHHVNLVTVAFVPFYWLGAGPHFLYLVETVWLAVGAVPVWLLARDHLRHAWFALVPAAAYLLHPTVEWVNWWHFHPDALMIAPLLFAWWLGERRRWGWFAVAVGIALSTKEDAGLAVLVLGALVAAREWRDPRGRRAGLWAAAAGLGWFLFCLKVVIPAANNGTGAFYEDFFPGFGTSLTDIAGTILAHPTRLWDALTAGDRASYYWELMAPVGFLPLGATGSLVGAPQLLVNAISGHGYTHDARFHYSSAVVAGMFIGTVRSLGWLAGRRSPAVRAAAVAFLGVSAVAAHLAWAPSPIGDAYDTGVWARSSPRHAAVHRAIDLVPAGAGVSATYSYVPHLTQREHIYEFPNPFVVGNWGVAGENAPDPRVVDWLVVDRRLLAEHRALFETLVTEEFDVVFERDDVVAARRRSAPD